MRPVVTPYCIARGNQIMNGIGLELHPGAGGVITLAAFRQKARTWRILHEVTAVIVYLVRGDQEGAPRSIVLGIYEVLVSRVARTNAFDVIFWVKD